MQKLNSSGSQSGALARDAELQLRLADSGGAGEGKENGAGKPFLSQHEAKSSFCTKRKMLVGLDVICLFVGKLRSRVGWLCAHSLNIWTRTFTVVLIFIYFVFIVCIMRLMLVFESGDLFKKLQSVSPAAKWNSSKGLKTFNSVPSTHVGVGGREVGVQLAGSELSREFICSHGNSESSREKNVGIGIKTWPVRVFSCRKLPLYTERLIRSHWCHTNS